MKYSIVLLVCAAMVFNLEPINCKLFGLIGPKLKLPAKIGFPNRFNLSNICGMTAMLPTKLRDTINIGYCSTQCIREGKRFGYCDASLVCQCVDVPTNTTTTAPAVATTATVNGAATTAAGASTTSDAGAATTAAGGVVTTAVPISPSP